MINLNNFKIVNNSTKNFVDSYSQNEILTFLICQEPLKTNGKLDTSVRRGIARAASDIYKNAHPEKRDKNGNSYSNVYFDTDYHDLAIENTADFINMLLDCCEEKINYQSYFYKALFAKSKRGYKGEDARYITNFVIDIDVHKSSTLSKEKINYYIDKIIDMYLERVKKSILPIPTVITKSGRGIHVFYTLVPYKIKNIKNTTEYLKTEKLIYSLLAQKVEENIFNKKENQHLIDDGFSLDKGAGINLTGRIRLPYSYNQKSGSYDEVIYFNPVKYEMEYFTQFFDVTNDELYKTVFKRDKKVSRKERKKLVNVKTDLSLEEFLDSLTDFDEAEKVACLSNNLSRLMIARMKAIAEIVKMNDGIVDSRHVTLYKYAHSALVYYRETDIKDYYDYQNYFTKVEKDVKNFNKNFKTPVKDEDIYKIINTMRNRLFCEDPAYHFTDKTFLNKIWKNESEEEVKNANKLYDKWKFIIFSKEKSSKKKNKARDLRNKKAKNEKHAILYSLLQKYSKNVNLNTTDKKLFKKRVGDIIKNISNDELCPFCAKTVKTKLQEWISRQWIAANWKTIRKPLLSVKTQSQKEQKKLLYKVNEVKAELIPLLGEETILWYSNADWNEKNDFKNTFRDNEYIYNLLEKWDSCICSMASNKRFHNALDDGLYKGNIYNLKNYFNEILHVINSDVKNITDELLNQIFSFCDRGHKNLFVMA